MGFFLPILHNDSLLCVCVCGIILYSKCYWKSTPQPLIMEQKQSFAQGSRGNLLFSSQPIAQCLDFANIASSVENSKHCFISPSQLCESSALSLHLEIFLVDEIVLNSLLISKERNNHFNLLLNI